MKDDNLKISKKERKAVLVFLFALGLINIVIIIAIIIYFIQPLSFMFAKKIDIYDEWNSNQSKYGTTDFFKEDETLFSINYKEKYYHFHSVNNFYDSAILLYKYNDTEYEYAKSFLLSQEYYNNELNFKYNFYNFCLNDKCNADYIMMGNKIEVYNILLYSFNDINNTISFYGFHSVKGSESIIYWREFIDIYFGDDLETINS